MPDPILAYGLDGELLYLNPAFTKIFGWSLDEMRADRGLFTPEDRRDEEKDFIDRTAAAAQPKAPLKPNAPPKAGGWWKSTCGGLFFRPEATRPKG